MESIVGYGMLSYNNNVNYPNNKGISNHNVSFTAKPVTAALQKNNKNMFSVILNILGIKPNPNKQLVKEIENAVKNKRQTPRFACTFSDDILQFICGETPYFKEALVNNMPVYKANNTYVVQQFKDGLAEFSKFDKKGNLIGKYNITLRYL